MFQDEMIIANGRSQEKPGKERYWTWTDQIDLGKNNRRDHHIGFYRSRRIAKNRMMIAVSKNRRGWVKENGRESLEFLKSKRAIKLHIKK